MRTARFCVSSVGILLSTAPIEPHCWPKPGLEWSSGDYGLIHPARQPIVACTLPPSAGKGRFIDLNEYWNISQKNVAGLSKIIQIDMDL